MTKTARASNAASRSESTATLRRSVAVVRALQRRPAGSADVYNLQVDGEPEFFANGLLVHNCDALRYLLLNIGTGASFLLDDEDGTSTAAAATAVDPALATAASPFAGNRFVLLNP